MIFSKKTKTLFCRFKSKKYKIHFLLGLSLLNICILFIIILYRKLYNNSKTK